MIERVAAAIANRRAGRRGAPAVSNVLDILKLVSDGKLYAEVMDDARAVIEAMREPTKKMLDAGMDVGGLCNGEIDTTYRKMIDAALTSP